MLTFLSTAAFAAVPLTALDLTGGDNGLNVLGGLQPSFGLNPLVGNNFYWFVLGVVAALPALSWYVLASQTRKAIQAIGRHPGLAEAMGYRVTRNRIALTTYPILLAS